MTKARIAAVAVLVLAVNNIGLIYFLKEKPSVESQASIQIQKVPLFENSVKPNTDEADQDRSLSVSDAAIFPANDSRVSQDETDVASAVRDYMASPEFVRVLDDYRSLKQTEQREQLSQFEDLSASELFSAYQASANNQEKLIILQRLAQNLADSDDGLDVSQMKELYRTEGVGGWVRTQLLSALLSKKDAEAVQWTKQLLRKGSGDGQGQYYEITRQLYELEPEFILDLAIEMPVERVAKSYVPQSFLYNDPDQAKVFFESRLDEILESNDSRVYEKVTSISTDMELSNAQERKIGELFASPKSSTRNFAVSFAANIEDIQILRQGYENLSQRQERQALVYQLIGQTESDAHVELGYELAAQSDDSSLKRLVKERRGY